MTGSKLLILVTAALSLMVASPVYAQPLDLLSSPCPSCGAELPDHLDHCPAEFKALDEETVGEGFAGLFMALYELFSDIKQAIGSASEVRNATAARSLPEAKQLAESAAALANRHRALVMGVNDVLEAMGKGGLSAVSTAPVVGMVIESIVAVHAAVHTTVGAQVLAQITGAEATRGHGGGSTPSLAALHELTVPRDLRAGVRPMLNNPGAFARCPRTNQYVSMCKCGRH